MVEKTAALIESLHSSMHASNAIILEHGSPLEIIWVSRTIKRVAKKSGTNNPLKSALNNLLTP